MATRTPCRDGYIERDGDHTSVWLWGNRPTSSAPTAKSIDEQLIGDINASHGVPRVIALLEEIRDRLAGVRPAIHVPTADECRRFGGKGTTR